MSQVPDPKDIEKVMRIRKEQRKILMEKLMGWVCLDVTNPTVIQSVLENANSLDEFERKAFIEKTILLPSNKETNSKNPTSTAENPTEIHNPENPEVINEETTEIDNSPPPKAPETLEEEQKEPTETILKNEDSLETVNDVKVEEVLLNDKNGLIAGDEIDTKETDDSSLIKTIEPAVPDQKTSEKGKSSKNNKAKKKNNGKNKKKNVREETDDELLNRLVEENKEVYKQRQIENDFVASLKNTTKSNKKGRRRVLVNEKTETTQNKNVIEEREREDLIDMLFSQCSYADLVIDTVNKAVNAFIDDIESVMLTEMHPDNIRNKQFNLFQKYVVLPNPNEEIPRSAKRFEDVYDEMWARLKIYIVNDQKYEKIRCFVYIFLLDAMIKKRVAIVPTLEKLLKIEEGGIPANFEDEGENEFLKLILSEYDELKNLTSELSDKT